MADDDSCDSSSITSATATVVTLGYASTTPTDDPFSQLGGTPTWPSATPPSASFASCKNCSDIMPLLLQLNADLPDRFPGHERRLYIWGCRKRACRRKEGAVRGSRGVKRTAAAKPGDSEASGKNEEVEQKPKGNMGATLFGGSSDPFASGSSNSNANPFSSSKPTTSATTEQSNPFCTSKSPPSTTTAQSKPFATAPAPLSSLAAKPPQKPPPSPSNTNTDASDLPTTFADKVRISSPHPSTTPQPEPECKPWPTTVTKPYPTFHIDAEAEYLSPSPSAQNGETSKAYEGLMDTSSDGNDGGGTGGKEVLYEDSIDKTFQHFADTIAQNPEQVLRYDFSGQPLLYSSTDPIGRLFSDHPPAHPETNAKIQVSSAQTGGNGIPRCQHCGSPRVFELQLTPHAIAELEGQEDAAVQLNEGMEWGAVVWGVCAGDCVGDAGEWEWREECVGVQWEERVERGKSRK